MIARILALLSVAVVAASAAACDKPLHFWIEEGQTLTGNLNTPPALSQNVHETLYPTVPVGNQNPMIACGAGETAAYAVTQSPAKHTGTPSYYTPFIGPFAVDANGQFKYLYLPTQANPTVWNGFDSFQVSATCQDVNATVVSTCDGTAYVSVTFTSAASQNTAPAGFQDGFPNGVTCTGNCRNVADGMWLARHTLPRVWDVTAEANGSPVKPVLTHSSHAADLLEFEWSSNYAIVSTYGAIGNMAVRFPTFESLRWAPGDDFSSTPGVAAQSTGFDQSCLSNQGTNGQGTDVWQFNPAQTDGSVPMGNYMQANWYQKFNGKHANCNVFSGTTNSTRNVCLYAPLLAPRMGVDENNAGIWRLTVKDCDLKWQGKFTWNAMRNQVLNNGNKAFAINLGNSGDYTITGEMYNQAVQPNSWTQPSRGYAAVDHKYLLTVILSQNTDFEFELGVDIFTVDLQHFRFFENNGDRSFGYNMIVYPATLTNLESNQAPDRRVTGYTWFAQEWVAPSQAQCPNCGTGGLNSECKPSVTASQYSGPMDAANCSNPVIVLYKGPSTASGSCSDAGNTRLIVLNTPGVSLPYEGSNNQIVCDDATYQNITLRGTAPGSNNVADLETAGFGFDGKITLTFELANGEHPHFVITPKMYVKSISVDGAFAGSTSTCRGSPSWPVANDQQLPEYVCEEVDARTFGPTDWAAIFFDIKDIDANLVSVQLLKIKVGSLEVVFIDANGTPNYVSSNQYKYFNFRNLKSFTGFDLSNPTAPQGVDSPKNMDFGFAFTPGAHNENAKVTIYCTLRIAQSGSPKARRFAAQQEQQDAHNTVQENINIQNKFNQQLSAQQRRVVEAQGSTASANSASSSSSSGSVTVIVLAAACAVLLAAVIGMVLYVVRQRNSATPKRVNSTA